MRIAEQMAEQDFDRDRPLWEMALVEGWDGDRSAVIIKLHHAITDGVGGMAMAASLFDLTREPSSALGAMPRSPPRTCWAFRAGSSTGRDSRSTPPTSAAAALTGGAIGLVERVVADPGESAVSGAAFAQSVTRLLAPASEPLSPLMHGRSLSVQLAVIQVPFKPFKAAAKIVGATLNDTYMAAVGGGVAAYHEAHNAPCEYVRVNMPVNMRTSSDDTAGNRWVPARFPMPIDSGDAATRIRRLSPLLMQARTEPALVVSDTIYRLLTALPQSAATSVASGMMKGCDLAITNVPGPPIALYASGAEVQAIVPFAPKGGAAANLGLMTYNGTAYVGINVDTRAIPDPGVFIECIRAAFDEVLAIADPDARAVLGLHSGAPVTEAGAAAPARRLRRGSERRRRRPRRPQGSGEEGPGEEGPGEEGPREEGRGHDGVLNGSPWRGVRPVGPGGPSIAPCPSPWSRRRLRPR